MDVALFIEGLTVRFQERIISGFYLGLLGYLVGEVPYYDPTDDVLTYYDPSYA